MPVATKNIFDDPTRAAGGNSHARLAMLDGWRALSICSVLAAHMLPLGTSRWNLNGSVAVAGMAVFFTLSGFLIVSILLRDPSIGRFLVRRIARIVPLAWLALVLTLPLQHAASSVWFANFLFYANLPPFRLAPWSSHFWSLGVEMQFYMAIAAVVLLFGRRGLSLIPVVAIFVTTLRIIEGAQVSIVTWLRVDEILAGGALALIIHNDPSGRWRRRLSQLPFWPVALLAAMSADPTFGWLNYARPYLVATAVGITIERPVAGLSPLLVSRPAAYLARISYALYVVHQFTVVGWLGEGTRIVKYAKRPLCLIITFTLAHISTFRFENRFSAWGHRITQPSTK